jgi:hypothetical protein
MASYHNLVESIVVEPGDFDDVQLLETIQTDALDFTRHTVAAAASDDEVKVSTAAAVGDVDFVAIFATSYPIDAGSAQLTFKVNDAGSPAVGLTKAQVVRGELFAGMGAAGLVPDSLFFSNASGSDVDVLVIVGRESS